MCVHSSSGMRRLPFSDDEFSSPPNKMARVEEPKKGTKCVSDIECAQLRLFTCWSRVFEPCSSLSQCVKVHAYACMCMCVCHGRHHPCKQTLGHVNIPGLSKHTYTNTHTHVHRWRLLWPNKIPRITMCTHTHANKLVPFTLYPIHSCAILFAILQ